MQPVESEKRAQQTQPIVAHSLEELSESFKEVVKATSKTPTVNK
jgi:hypothetical protein